MAKVVVHYPNGKSKPGSAEPVGTDPAIPLTIQGGVLQFAADGEIADRVVEALRDNAVQHGAKDSVAYWKFWAIDMKDYKKTGLIDDGE